MKERRGEKREDSEVKVCVCVRENSYIGRWMHVPQFKVICFMSSEDSL